MDAVLVSCLPVRRRWGGIHFVSPPALVALPVRGDEFLVQGLQLLHCGDDDVIAAISAHGLRGVVHVAAGGVKPCTWQTLRRCDWPF